MSVMNLELLDRALADIDERGMWMQSSWRFCLAARIAKVTGRKWESAELNIDATLVINEDGKYEHVSSYARRMLSLNSIQAADLFWGSNTREDLQAIRDRWARDMMTREALVTAVAG